MHLKIAGVPYKRIENPSAVAARLLFDGNIIGCFRDAQNVVPRALGNRSILADPRSADMKDQINSRVKISRRVQTICTGGH